MRYYLEFITVPLAALVLLYFSAPIDNTVVGCTFLGYMIWVMVEYWMHRWLFHKMFSKAHAVHHARPFDPDGSPPTELAQALLAMSSLILVWSCGLHVGGALASGFLLGYCSYIYTHHLIHNGSLKPTSLIRRRHEMHHRGWVGFNYNLLCPLGDLMFGTYQEPADRTCRECASQRVCRAQGQCREDNIAEAVATGVPCQPDSELGCRLCRGGACVGGPRKVTGS